VDGVTYDVTFYNSSYDSIYSPTAPTFLGNSSGAADAASALASALTSFGVTRLVGIGPPNDTLLVPFSDARAGVLPCTPCSGENTSYVAWQSTIKTSGTWTTDPAIAGYQDLQSNITGANDSVTYSYLDYPVFVDVGDAPSPAVPEPSTWAMMVLGFLGFASLHIARRARCASPESQSPFAGDSESIHAFSGLAGTSLALGK
jgi:hypothetical protein